MALTKYPNQRWLTVLNDNNITESDYKALLGLKPNARKLYECICYRHYDWDEVRFQFSSAYYNNELGIDESDVRKAWTELEAAGCIFKKERSSNEYYIKANIAGVNKTLSNPPSNNIKRDTNDSEYLSSSNDNNFERSKKVMFIKSHRNYLCVMAELNDTEKILATVLMSGNLLYNAEDFAAKYNVGASSVRKAFNSLKDKNYIIDINGELHFCAMPYFDTTDGYKYVVEKKYNRTGYTNVSDMKLHCLMCDGCSGDIEQYLDEIL